MGDGGGIGVGQGEPGGAGNIGGVGAQGMSGAMAGGPMGGGPVGHGSNSTYYGQSKNSLRPTQPPPFQIPANQVAQDITPWGQSYPTPPMNQANYFQTPAEQIDWGGFFQLFGGK